MALACNVNATQTQWELYFGACISTGRKNVQTEVCSWGASESLHKLNQISYTDGLNQPYLTRKWGVKQSKTWLPYMESRWTGLLMGSIREQSPYLLPKDWRPSWHLPPKILPPTVETKSAPCTQAILVCCRAWTLFFLPVKYFITVNWYHQSIPNALAAAPAFSSGLRQKESPAVPQTVLYWVLKICKFKPP